ncbi:hypothetical protein J4H86_14470 [Spiractinospora alimapuensis]|uniref:hypothetical protein n=1 Tax=Spiractinospora alimapuensis TaxID=2820884 RepID=UPI001F15D666|nr:hypothetical protein [Spiractinospora alimapuensis]QVQ50162.1 hypothetical protein J4H86_14470 [Spiractinospora alimapuensis]
MTFDAPSPILTRLAATSLVIGGVLFALYQFVRPFTDTAETMASTAWLASHLFAIGAFTLITLGLSWLPQTLRGTLGHRSAISAVIVSVLGIGLTLPYYGAETFMLRFVSQHALDTGDRSVVALADTLHTDIVATGLFAVGLLLLGAAAVLAAGAVTKSGHASVWSAAPFALGFVLLLPQFFTPQPIRMVHGVLLTAGCVLVARTLVRAGRTTSRATNEPVPV